MPNRRRFLQRVLSVGGVCLVAPAEGLCSPPPPKTLMAKVFVQATNEDGHDFYGALGDNQTRAHCYLRCGIRVLDTSLETFSHLRGQADYTQLREIMYAQAAKEIDGAVERLRSGVLEVDEWISGVRWF